MRSTVSTVMLVLLLGPPVAFADTAYVTDVLRLGLHEAEDTSDRAFRMLESGQAMEILSRDRNYANVRLPDATEGWVKAAYLVDEKPARLIVAELTAERDRALADLEAAQQAFAEPAAVIDALKRDLGALAGELEAANARAAALDAENEAIRGLEARYKGSLPLSWVAIAILVSLVAGLLLGFWWVDRQNRKRHGGIRVY